MEAFTPRAYISSQCFCSGGSAAHARSAATRLPKWKAETPQAASFVAFLDRTDNWELRDFSSAALAAHRFDGLLAVAGREVVDRLAPRLDRSPDPLREADRKSTRLNSSH